MPLKPSMLDGPTTFGINSRMHEVHASGIFSEAKTALKKSANESKCLPGRAANTSPCEIVSEPTVMMFCQAQYVTGSISRQASKQSLAIPSSQAVHSFKFEAI